ncbi:MAG: hypothetical protein LWW85_07295 [Marinilabiliales bacterium]|nr:hypothetical protein [Marinilabiliales bacterium]
MDRKIWLRVIREELGLLEQLASGMIEDQKLTREEVELSISRAKIVVREFEMLLLEIPKQAPSAASAQAIQEIPQLRVEQPSVSTAPQERFVEPEILPETPLPFEMSQPVYQLAAEPVPEPTTVETPPRVAVREDLIPETPVIQTENEPAATHPEPAILDPESENSDFSHFKPLPLKSLKEGLLLNDRYLFQRELFGNEKARLDQAVEALDALQNIQEAVAYLKANFRWTRSEASEKFVQLVKRRFS